MTPDPIIVELTRVRRERGWSAAELGRRIGLSQAAITSYERGDRNPPLSTVRVLAGTLDHLLSVRPADDDPWAGADEPIPAVEGHPVTGRGHDVQSEHGPMLVYFDAEKVTTPAEVCNACSDEDAGRWVPVSQCDRATEIMFADDTGLAPTYVARSAYPPAAEPIARPTTSGGVR
jgi:transcriptional regulator with XRE-family HTH domain